MAEAGLQRQPDGTLVVTVILSAGEAQALETVPEPAPPAPEPGPEAAGPESQPAE